MKLILLMLMMSFNAYAGDLDCKIYITHGKSEIIEDTPVAYGEFRLENDKKWTNSTFIYINGLGDNMIYILVFKRETKTPLKEKGIYFTLVYYKEDITGKLELMDSVVDMSFEKNYNIKLETTTYKITLKKCIKGLR